MTGTLAPAFQETRFRSWRALIEHLQESLVESGAFDGAPAGSLLFRGQANAKWGLTSRLHRDFTHVEPAARAELVRAMRVTFQRRGEAVAPARTQWDSEIEVDELLQHYGAPTQLLDWTESPYVAAYFACASAYDNLLPAGRTHDIAIWVLNRHHPLLTSSPALQVFDSHPAANPRAAAQRGAFTRNQSPYADLADAIRAVRTPATKNPSWALKKWCLPREERSRALRDLEYMGITSESIYPELEGVARYAFHAALDRGGLLGT